MGFKVIDNLVIVDHSTNHYAITTPTKKRSPCIYIKKNINSLNLSIYSIFYRSVIDRKLHKLGDNCPLLYALKGKQNLVVTKDSMKDLKIPFYQILEILKNEITDKYKKIDFIVPMPSKHNLSLQLARRLQRQFHQSIVLEDLLIKKSNREMSEEVANSDIPNTDKHLILQRIKQAEQRNKLFSVSDIPPPIRKYVHPIKLNETQIVEHGIYIIVDDLVSTACTLSSAQQVLVSNSAEIDILAVSLFSPVNNRIKET